MENINSIKHEHIKVSSTFETFTGKLEAAAGHFDSAVLNHAGTDPENVLCEIHNQVDGKELIIFNIEDHGRLLTLFGQNKKAKQYIIGNPLIAVTMTQLDLRAALYAPLRVLVYEGHDQCTYVEYDLPSTLFGMFRNDTILKVGISLDDKLKHLLSSCDAV